MARKGLGLLEQLPGGAGDADEDEDGHLPEADKMIGLHNLIMGVMGKMKQDSVSLSKVKLPQLIEVLIREGDYPDPELPNIKYHATRQKKKIKEGLKYYRTHKTAPNTLCNAHTELSVSKFLDDISEMEDEFDGKEKRTFSGAGELSYLIILDDVLTKMLLPDSLSLVFLEEM